MFYDIFVELSQLKGVKPSRAADEMKINRATVTNWKKNGSIPNTEIMRKIIDYFGVTTDFLLGTENVLRKQRRDNLLSLEKMSEETGIPEQSIVDWEAGTSFPNDEQIKRLAEYFGIPEGYIRNHKGSPDDGLDHKLVASIDTTTLIEAVKNKKAPDIGGLETDPLLTFYGDVKEHLSQDDKDDIRTIMELKAKRNKEKNNYESGRKNL